MQEELTKALEVLIENDVDMILVEYFFYIQEMEWAIELCRKVLKAIFMTELNSEFAQYNKPIAATMAIGPKGDRSGISAGECAVRSASNLPCLVFQNLSFSQQPKMNKSQDGKGRRRHCWGQLPL